MSLTALLLGLLAVAAPSAAMDLAGSTHEARPSAVNAGGQNGLASSSYELTHGLGELGVSSQSSAGYALFPAFSAAFPRPSSTGDVSAAGGFGPGQADLSWHAAGQDGDLGGLAGSSYIIQFTSNAAWAAGSAWDPTGTLPADVYTVEVDTNGVTPGTAQVYTLSGLDENQTYYARLWTVDSNGTPSPLSNGATAQAQVTTLSLSVSPTTYAFGSQAVATSTHAAAALAVTNAGNTASNYSVSATTVTAGSAWQVWDSTSSAPAYDKLLLRGLFHASRPALDDFGAEDLITESSRLSQTSGGGGRYTYDGTQTGLGVAAGASRSLWLRLDLPSTTSSVAPQTLKVTVRAGQ